MYVSLIPLMVLLYMKLTRNKMVSRYDLVKYQDILRDMLEYMNSLQPTSPIDKMVIERLIKRTVAEFDMISELLKAGFAEAGVIKW